MRVPALVLIGVVVVFVAYTYVGYPLLLRLLAWFRRPVRPATSAEWPAITITLAAYNEAAAIRDTLESLLALDYPADRRQILVISDASTDGTDGIVAGYADRGVELLRMPERGGKDAAENAALAEIRGEIVVNTDASVRVRRDAVKHLVGTFADSSVGLASGRDLSVSRLEGEVNLGESKYVGYEMWLRDLETRVSGIIGASGCFYGIRAALHRNEIPEGLSRDFAAALVTRERGLRSVSVNEAICYVPRAASVRSEYRRKVRTFGRGLRTLLYKRTLLNPFRYGLFSWMLFSHKLCRWLVPWAFVLGLIALLVASATEPWGRWALGAVLAGLILAVLGWVWPSERRIPRVLALPAYLLTGNLAVLHAWSLVLRGRRSAVWEPTRREVVGAR
jgi:cellulose synthase/poly-beta-1,6-N-acetylglucosamine synthase-like glycosyltransferase